MTSQALAPNLDDAVSAALQSLSGAGRPDALLLSATGAGPFPDRLADARAFDLAECPEIPGGWRSSTLYTGELEGARLWVLDDEAPEPARGAWEPGFPVWLAAAAGARILVHTSAGVALDGADGASFVVASDHVRFGDLNPLIGLGASTLGPMFPDLSFLHDATLRERAKQLLDETGARSHEGVLACTRGPSLDTPAERSAYAQLGHAVCAQGVAAPLLAAGHAGLVALSIVAVIDDGSSPADVARMVQTAEKLAPLLEEALVGLAPAIAERAAALREERPA